MNINQFNIPVKVDIDTKTICEKVVPIVAESIVNSVLEKKDNKADNNISSPINHETKFWIGPYHINFKIH